MLLLISCAYLLGFHNYRMYPLVQITPLTLGFWAFAITYPTLVGIALLGRRLFQSGYGGYGGHYLHSFAPALAPIIGIAIMTVARNWLARTAVCLLSGYNVMFLFGATFMQFLYFAGCGSNGSARFSIASASECWNDWQRLTNNLDTLAFPLAAFWLVAGGALALASGASASLMLATSHARKLVAHASGAQA
jgi:hypothetical protein